MAIGRKIMTAANRALVAAAHPLGLRVRGRADFAVSAEPLPRLDTVWLSALAELGTVHVPHSRLREAAQIFDARSFACLLWHCRAAGGATRWVNDTGTPSANDAVTVNFDYYSLQSPPLALPYGMHPGVYAAGGERVTRPLRAAPRRFRLAFAGTTRDTYAQIETFPVVARPRIVQALVENFREQMLLIECAADVHRLSQSDRPIVVVLNDDTRRTDGARLSLVAYLRLIASADFALCPPGLTVPHSHNLVEALAVGTVPVTNYAHFCRPILEPGKTCLSFGTIDELLGAVRVALAMPAEEAAAMRVAAAAHYDRELRPETFAAKLAEALRVSRSGAVPVAAVNEFWSPRLYAEARAGT